MGISSKSRYQNPDINPLDLQELVSGNISFVIDLYQSLRERSNENLFFSPYSISLALAMTFWGACGKTALEMAKTMHLTLLNDSIHTMVNALDLEITSRNHRGDEMSPGFKLNIVNSAWVQYDRPFERAFLDLLAENYYAELCLTDFSSDPEGSRHAINQWVSDETNSKIEDLIPDGAINALTWLVLANAIYFNGSWQSTFDEGLTDDSTSPY